MSISDGLAPSYFDDAGELVDVTFGLHRVVLRFDRMSVEIYNGCEIRCPDGRAWVWRPKEKGGHTRVSEAEMNDMTGFAKLLESEYRSFEVLADGKLRLNFANGCALVLWADESGFESFVIGKTGDEGGRIVVH